MSINKFVYKILNTRIFFRGDRGGFTLAEIIIVIGVIGIVAEITIPSLIFNIQKQNWAVTLQKSYTNFNQALIKVSNDYGCIGDLRCTGLFDSSSQSLQILGGNVASYFKVAKNCGLNENQGCFSNSVAPNYDGTGTRDTTYDQGTAYRFITADGVSISMFSSINNCSQVNGLTYLSQVCGWVYIDVNGLNRPNNIGRDIFRFFITNGKGPLLYPVGGSDCYSGGVSCSWNNGNNCNSNNPSGTRCPGRIMEEGWQMKY